MIKDKAANDAYRGPPGRSGLPLMPTLMLGIGSLVLLAVGSALSVQWITGRAIILDFASRLIARSLDTTELDLRQHLDAAVNQASFIAESIKTGRFEFTDPALEDFVAGTIAAAPQIGAVILTSGNSKALRLVRGASATSYQLDRLNVTEDPQLLDIANETRAQANSYWGKPVYRETSNETFLNYRVPIRKENVFLGSLAIAISTEALSIVTKKLSEPPNRLSFMLYGRDRLLAHPSMTGATRGRSRETPLPTLAAFDDPVIKHLPDLPRLEEDGITLPDARQTSVEAKRYFIFTRDVAGYGAVPIVVGEYVLASAVDAPLIIFYWAIIGVLGLLAISLIAAALMAGAIAGPIRRVTRGAVVIGALDFDKVAPLQPGYFRETNDLARSFNSMLDGLKAFGRYVPLSLVTRLVKEGRVGTGSEERKLAIMFTDIVGFTSTCENMPAAGVAEFLNQHLTLISGCIERENGTIDKYIGDAVMAFWGAPNQVENPAECACRSAIAVQKAISADNSQRAARGLKPIRVRIGIHLGPVIVGDIGAPNRINYTIVGDAVNAAQRLESLGKTIDPEAEAIVLISREVFEELPAGFQVVDRGAQLLKGKHEALGVYQLFAGPCDDQSGRNNSSGSISREGGGALNPPSKTGDSR
jgi:adenylate cyclase